MAVRIAPVGRQQFFDSQGRVANGMKLFTYAAGTVNKLNTYTSSTGGVANANPIVLNSDGRTPSGFWLTDGTLYKLVLAPANDTDPPTSPIWTEDNIGANDSTLAALISTVGTIGASLIGFIQAGIGAIGRTVLAKLRDTISITDFMTSAQVTDYTTRAQTLDLSTAIQAAIDAVSTAGGGDLWAPIGTAKCNVILKSGVYLKGAGAGYLASGSVFTTSFIANATGAVIDTPVTAINNCGVSGINVGGLGAGTAAKGIHFRSVARGQIKNVSANNISDEGILLDSACIACVIEDIAAINCVLNRTQAAVIAAVDVHGTDHFLSRIESTVSGSIQGTVQSVNLYCVAIAVRMTNGMISDCIGEISDVGFYVSGNLNRFTGNRADLNYGHGWQITGSGNQFASCNSVSNSQDTTNTYDNWIVPGVNNFFSSPVSISNVAKVPRYGFNDTAPSSAANKNYYNDPRISGTHGTAAYNHTAGLSAAWSFAKSADLTLTANSATPDVTGFENFATNNTNPTSITNFTGGVNGQELRIVCGDSNTTFQHNGTTIVTPGAGNVKARSGQTYFFKKNSAWRLIGEDASFMPNVSADNGNAAKALQARVDESTQIWATAITADRAVTLSTTGAIAGAKFRIVRAATATGAFNVNVGTGPLKALNTAGSYCDVEYNGSAWVLTAYGLL